MRIAVFSSKPHDRTYLDAANAERDHELVFFEARLSAETVDLAKDYDVVCLFVSDEADATVVERLASSGTSIIALRSAGYNNVDLKAAEQHGLCVVRVPAYSPHAVAEHAIGLLLALDRRIHRAYERVRTGNMALHGLMGTVIRGKTVGIIGTGRIGAVAARILLHGFGCTVLAYDQKVDEDLANEGVTYLSLEEVIERSNFISLHCPLTPETHHMIDDAALSRIHRGAMLINTSRGGLLDTEAAIRALKDGRLGALAMDVYEEEGDLFFEDLSDTVIDDDVFARLLTMPNVLITGHQAFFTHEAMVSIAETTLGNIDQLIRENQCDNAVCCCQVCKCRSGAGG